MDCSVDINRMQRDFERAVSELNYYTNEYHKLEEILMRIWIDSFVRKYPIDPEIADKISLILDDKKGE